MFKRNWALIKIKWKEKRADRKENEKQNCEGEKKARKYRRETDGR